MDCGDRAADWLRSVVNIDNVRLVRHQFTDDVTQQSHTSSQQSTNGTWSSHQSIDDTQLNSDVKSTTAHS